MPWANIRTKRKFGGPIYGGEGGGYIREEKHFSLQSVKLITFLSSRFCNNHQQQPQMVRITLDKEVTKINYNGVSRTLGNI